MTNPPAQRDAPTSTVLPIDERIERAIQLVFRSRIFFDIWFYFEGRDTRPAILDTMQEYSEFFRFMPEAHFVAFVVTMASVFDPDSETISLPHLAGEMRRAKLLTKEAHAQVKILIKQATPLTEKLGILRNNVFAHRSATMSYDCAFKKAGVTAAQLRGLTEIALKIVNQFGQARGRSEYFFSELPRDDAAAMLKALSAARLP